MNGVLIAGGGIGGLCAALALRRRAKVRLVEREPAFSPVGAGIVLAPNATEILARFGVDTRGSGEPVDKLVLRTAAGRVLQETDLRRWRASHGTSFAFHRAELHEALLAALGDSADLRLGVSIESLVEETDGVEVTFSDGERGRYDLVVAADGIHSHTRELAGVTASVRYSGYTCWRVVCPNPGVGESFEAWGRGARLGAVPLRGGRLYAFLVATAPRRAPSLSWPDGFRERFAGFAEPCGRIFAAMEGARLMHHDLEELDRPLWGTARVWLLGDAAHAMTPNLGQGAAMAIEDAFVLAAALGSDVAASRVRYVAARDPRVRQIQLGSRRIGQIAHWQRGAAVWLRDHLMSALPQAVGDRQFLGVVEPGLELLRA